MERPYNYFDNIFSKIFVCSWALAHKILIAVFINIEYSYHLCNIKSG